MWGEKAQAVLLRTYLGAVTAVPNGFFFHLTQQVGSTQGSSVLEKPKSHVGIMAPAPVRWLFNIARLAALVAICYAAVYIRLDAVFTYGRVIHEFDPWFNYRATEYLVKNGYDKFNTWFDDESWYVVPFLFSFVLFIFSLVASAVFLAWFCSPSAGTLWGVPLVLPFIPG